MLAARRSPLAPAWAAAAVARRRTSVWTPSLQKLTSGRWLATSANDDDGPRDDDHDVHNHKEAPQGQKKRETAAQKNSRLFALLPTLLRMFEASAGHRVVPYSFLVPNDWADGADGIRLRRTLNAIATNVKLQKQHPQVVLDLQEMGIPLGKAAHRKHMWEQETLVPLKTFYAIHGHTLVPRDFQVPRGDVQWPESTWGYKLGLRVANLRQRRHLLNDAEFADLSTMEFSFDVHESNWSERVLPALETYVQLQGNCLVPSAFEVPRSDKWPRKAWGLPLGRAVSTIRSAGAYAKQVERDRERLEAINFVWDYFEHTWSEVFLPSLEEYYRLNGHSRVPCSFVVPSESPWPEAAWGHKLGSSVAKIRSDGIYSDQAKRDAARLRAVDFLWDVNDERWLTAVLPALETFAAQFGHCDITVAYIVPSELPWPKQAWGLRLGLCVKNMRAKGPYRAQATLDADKLEAIGFVWDSSEHRWSRWILPSFETFRQLNGHCNIPKQFVVPSESPWPKEAWGLKLGACVQHIQARGDYRAETDRDADKLTAIGFVWNPKDHKWTRCILPALETFHQLHDHTRVPLNFVVPSASPWPEETWGLQLGTATLRVRQRGAYAQFVARDKARLAAIGFEVDPSRVEEKEDPATATGADVEDDNPAV